MKQAFCLLVLAAMVSPAAVAAEPGVNFNDGVLTIDTDRWQLSWSDGSMTRLITRLPESAPLSRDAGMDVNRMPNGLGSFHGRQREGWAQHHPWGGVSPPYAAQHPPADRKAVKFEPIPRGARLTYTNLAGDETASLVQELTVDDPTGDLVIRQRGSSAHGGVFGIGFSLLNLRPDVELIVPYFGGQRWGREQPGRDVPFSIAWPSFWSAALVIGEQPGGTGTFAVWAQDAAMRPKYFRRVITDAGQGLNFESCADLPYDEQKSFEAIEWRFNTFAGNWTEPAERYKRWLAEGVGIKPRTAREPKWVEDVALIVPSLPGEAELKKLAEVVEPSRVLLMDFSMLAGFNRRIPEYKPQDSKFAERVAAAKRLGYRVGCYTSMALIDQEAHPSIMRDYGLTPYYNALADHDPKQVQRPTEWLVYVHPGSSKWRAFYASRMRELHEQYGLEFLYQDVTGCQQGSAGLIEGRTFSKAVVDAMADIRAAVPQAAMAGEFWNEVTVAGADFGLGTFLAWGDDAHRQWISRPDAPHPILSYLFSDACTYWPHQIQVRDVDKWHRDQNINETIGALPVWETSAEDRGSEARVLIELVKLRAEGFRPHFPKVWERGVASYLRDPAGRLVKFRRDGASTWCVATDANGSAETLRYGRVTGLRAVERDAPTHIDGWIAYGDRGPVGLDPAQWYCVFPGKPAHEPRVRVAALPEKTSIRGTREAEDYLLVELGGDGQGGDVRWTASEKPQAVLTSAGPVADGAAGAVVKAADALLFTWGAPQPLALDAPISLADWRYSIVSAGQTLRSSAPQETRDFELAGATHRGYRVFPPTGGPGAEVSIDRLVTLPNEPGVKLVVQTGLLGGQGDGVHFVVRVNGTEVARQFRETKPGWQEMAVPLRAYAGRTVVLSLAVDCGPSGFNLSCDESVWGEPVLVH